MSTYIYDKLHMGFCANFSTESTASLVRKGDEILQKVDTYWKKK